MHAIKKIAIFALALMALAGMIPITANAADEAPAIMLSPANGSISLRETDAGDTNVYFNVQLTVPPPTSITVVLEVTRNGAGNGSLPVLSQYEIPFEGGQTKGAFYFSELDGTAESEMGGFRINAYIKETTPSTFDPSKTWREIYQSAELDFFVRNVYPQIVTDTSFGEELSATINVPFSINWSVNDSPADMQGMRATLMFNGDSVSMTLDPSTNVYTKEIVFTSAGYKTINLTVEDKDGAMDTFTWSVRGGVPDDRQKELIGDYTWAYRIQNGGAVLAGLMDIPAISPSPEGALSIPPELGGCPVVGIGADAFAGCENLTIVTIPSSVTNIDYYAFYGCSGLTSVTIPEGVTSIGSSAFSVCTGLTSVTIPSSVISIGNYAFQDCIRLTSVVIPSSVTSIGDSALYGCERLSTVHVEKGDAARVRGLLERRSGLDLDSISFVEDWVRVDETVILPSAVIEEGMAKYPALAALAGGDVEAFAKLPSAAGKLDRSGRQMHVWQDLVAGTDPTDPDDQFKITAIAMENGTIKVTWSPDLNENGTKNVRRYIQYGSKTIGEAAAWVDLLTVSAAERNDYKFRKVTVEMP